MLDDQQVVSAAPVQVRGVAMLGVQRVRGDDGIGDLDAVAQRREPGNFVGRGVHLDLAQHHAMSVVERREQMPAVLAAVPGPA